MNTLPSWLNNVVSIKTGKTMSYRIIRIMTNEISRFSISETETLLLIMFVFSSHDVKVLLTGTIASTYNYTL